MDHLCLFMLSILTTVLPSYQSVTFVPTAPVATSSFSTVTIHNRLPTPHKRNNIGRSTRSFNHIIPLTSGGNELWHNSIYISGFPLNVGVEIGRGGHLTPDFSDGLAYPDPFLVTGVAAEAIANLLYSHELFYSDYPHVDALLRNQELRQVNGLAGHRLGSIRPESPFYRYRTRYIH